eukprot:15475098-Alexandrium_andersonii.AAC.1
MHGRLCSSENLSFQPRGVRVHVAHRALYLVHRLRACKAQPPDCTSALCLQPGLPLKAWSPRLPGHRRSCRNQAQ